MKYKLLPKQREFIEVPHDYSLDVAVYQGGFGSGKTFAGSLLGILLALKFPKIVGLVGALTFPMVRDTTLETYFEHLNNMGFKERKHYTYSKSECRISFKNGSKVLFRHFEQPSKLKSLNLGFVQIEEMSEVPESTFLMLLGRLRQKIQPTWQNFRYRLFGHTNPEECKGYIYKHFVETKNPNYRLIIAPTSQNIYLPDGFVDELKRLYDEDYYRANVLGQWVNIDTNLVVKDFDNENIFEANHDPHLPLHITCDFNVDPMCWIFAHKSDENVYFIDEIALENTTTSKACDVFYEKFKGHDGKIIINGDASGDNRTCTSEYTNYVIIRKKLEAFGFKDIEFNIRAFNPPIKNRVQSFNSRVKSFSGERHVFISRKCKQLLYNIYNLKYREGTSQIEVPMHHQIKRDKKLKFLTHPFDAASYLVEYYWPITY